MPFVLDASITACWAFDDEHHPAATLALERLRADEALVPSIWFYEIRNILVVNERRGRISAAHTASMLHILSRLGIRSASEPEDDSLLELARLHRLTVYDAAYLAVAKQESLPLASLDAQLIKAAMAEAVPVLGSL